MNIISQIFVRKKLFGQYLGTWSAPLSFLDFYFAYEDKETLIQNSDITKSIDKEGNILSSEDAFKIFLAMEKVLVAESSKSRSTSHALDALFSSTS